MMRWCVITAWMVVIVAVGGCNMATPGKTRSLGTVDYSSAFLAGRKTMAQFFSVKQADINTGLIEARPDTAKLPGERLLGKSPGRRKASLRIWRQDGQVFARASVAVQREGSAVYRLHTASGENYDQVPNKSPAEEAAATTSRQNQIWKTQSYDHALERKMLENLYRSLHPEVE